MAEAMNDNPVYVAVSKDVGVSKLTLLWALRKFPLKKLFLLHVHQQTPMSPTSSGLEQSEISAFLEWELASSCESLDKYCDICEAEGVIKNNVDIHFIEADNVEEGIVGHIYEKGIKNLIMGAAADSHYTEVMVNVMSTKAKYVRRHAPHCCKIWFVCNGNLIQTRFGLAGSSHSSSESLSSHHGLDLALVPYEGEGRAEHGTESDAPDADISVRGFETISDEEQRQRLEIEELQREMEQHDEMEREREEALSSFGVTQILYMEEVSQRIEAEEELHRAISEMENMKMVQMELQEQLLSCPNLDEGEPSSSLVQGVASAEPPSNFTCPISRDIMRNPHVAADGFSYEEEHIRSWLSRGGDKSPMTNLSLEHLNLTPNNNLRIQINEWLEQNPQFLEA